MILKRKESSRVSNNLRNCLTSFFLNKIKVFCSNQITAGVYKLPRTICRIFSESNVISLCELLCTMTAWGFGEGNRDPCAARKNVLHVNAARKQKKYIFN